MKNLCCIALLLVCIYVKAGSCSANGNGNWETAGTWSCGHVPGAGDNVTIGTLITVTVTGNNGANIGNLSISGTLKFTNGSKINLASSSVVNIFFGGSITGGNAGAKLIFPSSNYSGPFATTGPFYFSNTASGTGLLPLTLLSFYSAQQNQDIVLYWRTADEENINSFEIERSGNGSADWQEIQSIPSMAGDGDGFSYSFTDRTVVNGDRYYRLKIVDRDGKYVYSKVLSIPSSGAGMFSIMPTLVMGTVNVRLPISGTSHICIYNTYGHLVKTLSSETDVFTIDVAALTKGEYFLQTFQGKNSYTAKFLKQ